MSIMTSIFELYCSYQRLGGQVFMKENPIIVPVALSDSNLKSHSVSETNNNTPVCHFKIKDAEVTFYNGVNKYILHAVLAEMSKYAR